MKPCIGCGYCCSASPCPVARLRYSDPESPCPALTWSKDHKRYYCRIVLGDLYGLSIHKTLAIGKGCNSPLNTWRKNLEYKGDINELNNNNH